MSELSDFLMEHGILKNADAEAMATEIEEKFAREREEFRAKCAEMWNALKHPDEILTRLRALSTDCGKNLLEKLERLERERDQAIHEAKRRDQKWMDGINEVVGEKLDFDDPCSANAASTALSKWAAKQKLDMSGPCLECREPALPLITVIGPSVPRGTSKPRHFCSIRCFWKWIQRVESARDEGGRLDRVYSWD